MPLCLQSLKFKLENWKHANIYTNAKTMNYELKRLELAIMNVFMYLLVLIIGKSKGSLCPQGMCSI